jgi:hypothetical protein
MLNVLVSQVSLQSPRIVAPCSPGRSRRRAATSKPNQAGGPGACAHAFGAVLRRNHPHPPQFRWCRRLRLVSAIARGRRWLEELISDSVTDAEQIALRERCSVRHVNMTISLAFLAPKLVRAAVEGRLPRGINIERLRSSGMESAVRSAWVESATIAHAQKHSPLPTPSSCHRSL